MASQLARYALEDISKTGLPIILVCPYINKWLHKHPEYKAQTVLVRPEHLAATPRSKAQ